MWAAATETNWHGERFQAMTNIRCAVCPSEPPPATQQVYNCAELLGGSEQPPSTLPSTESTKQQPWSWWDKVRPFAVCPQLCCIFSLTQPSHGFGEVKTVRDSHSSLLATQFFSVQKLLQGRTLKSPIFLEPAFPHTLLHYSLVLTLCYYKILQVCAAQIH